MRSIEYPKELFPATVKDWLRALGLWACLWLWLIAVLLLGM